ncbi:MAG: exodeoxyribonuclease V subunit gamma [Burkholderiaceae bacterium]|nr:exodeoxyribonuclease V subunit gamma [Burkholderiaceae bacterium]
MSPDCPTDRPPVAPHAAALPPGLLVLQGNRLEWLLETLVDWLAAHPLAPLETETVLVQSNGIAEWLKMALAQRAGVCAATRVELPARFLWRLYRGVLGRAGAPARSPLDEAPLAWRLMRLLPRLASQPGYAPLAQFLAAGQDGPAGDAAADLPRRLQLARKLADLYDQYQVYRADWLQAWRAGEAVLIDARGQRSALPAEQRWQALLWQALCDELDETQAAGVRSEVHARAVAALDAAAEGGPPPLQPLPRRVVVFGVSHLPQQTLQALGALARHAQVLLAVPNPCRYHWADVIEGRELLGRARPLRQGHRGGVDLLALPLEAAHARANPLLAAWGRQARDFLRLLDAFDDTQAHARAMDLPRVDLFDEAPGSTLLAQLQARIRDNLSAAEPLEGATPPPAQDRSIVFHVAHSAMREVEILHDELLALLAAPPPPGEAALAPRDIVVMVPDIEPWAPLIHAVFGRHAPGDARRIPYEIADLRARSRAPLLRALEWLLRVDEQRCTAGELRDLLEVPAVARRFGLDAQADEGREVAARWLAGAGVRWGLDGAQRDSLGLGACGEANTWRFGLRRMLLGYAVGQDDADAAEAGAGDWQGIAPYDEVGGLEAVVAGSLAALVDALASWWATSRQPAAAADWGPRCRALLQAFFQPADEDDRLLLAGLEEALARWQDDCEAAGYDEPVPLAVLREAWLAGVDEPGLRSRFLCGGVVFCTLMPMRAIPFPVVALLGMNDGDYPRRTPRSDFDLIGAPGQRRPGDRARRDDDRLLMLEAVLAARRVLHVSWAGRSLRDNSVQPPSVLVAQLRDAIAASWGPQRLAALTTEHPLQPFSRRYFEAGSPLRTWAREWRAAHDGAPAAAPGPTPLPGGAVRLPLDLRRLETWLRRPVAAHWRERLGVDFPPLEAAAQDDEPLALDALDETVLLQDLVAGLRGAAPRSAAELGDRLARRVQQLARRGLLPLGALGPRWQRHFQAIAEPMLRQWAQWQVELPQAAKPLHLVWPDRSGAAGAAPLLDDWLDGLRSSADAGPVWLQLQARRLAQRPRGGRKAEAGRPSAPVPRPEAFLGAWLRLTVAAAMGVALPGRLLGRDIVALLTPPPAEVARQQLERLLAAWRQSLLAPPPVALRTALAFLEALAEDALKAGRAAEAVYDDLQGRGRAEGLEPALARCWPDWESLAAEPWPPAALDPALAAEMAPPDPALAPAFGAWAQCLYAPLREWVHTCVQSRWLEGAAPGDDDEDAAGDAPGEDEA